MSIPKTKGNPIGFRFPLIQAIKESVQKPIGDKVTILECTH
jgi:hypothetical protein